MREVKVGIAYCVRRADKPMYLGRMGGWFSDIRLAAIYASPQSARMAAGRLKGEIETDVWEVQVELLEKLESASDDDDEGGDDSGTATSGAGVSISLPVGKPAPTPPSKIIAPPAQPQPDKTNKTSRAVTAA